MSPKALALLISTVVLAGLLLTMVVFAGGTRPPAADAPRDRMPRPPAPTDHSAFFAQAFADGPSVTRACLACHPLAAAQVMGTTHWTWGGAHPAGGGDAPADALGKRTAINNFCIGIAANWPRCTSCHAGYGWTDDGFLERATPEQVDCLVCHDGTGSYQKDPVGAGAPAPGTDLLAVARSVTRTSRATCGGCHFKGGGGDGVKHGDLDETMYFPQDRVDVHMGRHGLRCADCHRSEGHAIRGRLLPQHVDAATRVRCEDCHAPAPHGDERLDAHLAHVACQTCHVPRYAVETATKLWWDWSKAGRDGPSEAVAAALAEAIAAGGEEAAGYPDAVRRGFAAVGRDPDVHAHYDKTKGLFLVARRQVPEYAWYDGTSARYRPGQRWEGPGPVEINAPGGSVRDPAARIWPFKVHRGIQPFDLEGRHLLVPHTFGPGGYWKEFDWDRALRSGAKASGVPYGGRAGWITTQMHWPQNHMVAPKEEALRCTDCHGPGGRLPWSDLGYPGDPALEGGRARRGLLPAPAPEGRR